METLKLTTLFILIPFGLQLSGTAAAYPEPLTSFDDLNAACVLSEMIQPKLKEQNDTSHSLTGVDVDLIAPTDTMPLDKAREAQACHLDLDLLETE